MKKIIFIFFIFWICCGASDLKPSSVYELTPESFDRLVKNGRETWIVEFYSPDCIYCQQFAPEFEATAAALDNSNMKAGKIDAVQFDDFSGRYGIKGFPTLKIFRPGSPVPKDYQGPRMAWNIINAAKKFTQDLKTKRGMEEHRYYNPR